MLPGRAAFCSPISPALARVLCGGVLSPRRKHQAPSSLEAPLLHAALEGPQLPFVEEVRPFVTKTLEELFGDEVGACFEPPAYHGPDLREGVLSRPPVPGADGLRSMGWAHLAVLPGGAEALQEEIEVAGRLGGEVGLPACGQLGQVVLYRTDFAQQGDGIDSRAM